MQNDEIKSSPDNEALGNEVQSASDSETSSDAAQIVPSKMVPGEDGATPAASIFTINNMPSGHSDQWYKRLPHLFHIEVNFMRKKHPQAKYGFYPTSGDMFWKLELKVDQGLQPWTVLLRYDKDHPNNNHFGGSIKVIPVKPTFEEIQRQARAAFFQLGLKRDDVWEKFCGISFSAT